ncbi:UNVERIFIED_CONTAM: putative disease resistance protein, partial [Sesamum indicum]
LPTTEIKLLEEYGREIVKKCGYLPLPISVIGGTLRHEKASIEWKNVCRNLDSYLQHGRGLENDKGVNQILDLSDNVLPYNPKPCFLYLACFKEDKKIDTEKLYLLWMAEGMISSEDKGRGESLRDVAERYLFELANRCMVQVEIDELPLYNRKNEGFLEVIDKEMGSEESSICKTNRLAIYMDSLDNDLSYRIGENKNIRFLLFLQTDWRNIVWYNYITFGIFKSLKVLVLEGYTFENLKLPKGIENLKLLKLLNIEELRLPNYIYKMRHLRHLFLGFLHESVGGEKLKLEGLNELEMITGFNSLVDDITHLLKLPKLRVLEGRIFDEESLSMIVDHILNHQEQFRDVQLNIDMGDNMDLEDGSTLLKREIVCEATGFPQLRELSLNDLRNLAEWRVEKGAMHNLSHLVIAKCSKLKMIPDGLEFINTLKTLIIIMLEEFVKRVGVVDGDGEDYHKIKHIPDIFIYTN